MAKNSTYFEYVCERKGQFKPMIALCTAVLFVMLAWLPFVDPNSGTYAVVVINIIGAGAFSTLAFAFLWFCPSSGIGRSKEDATEAE